MSTTITAALQDSRLNEIRNAVQLKTGTIPYLLLPVRIETRFMTVPKKTAVERVSVSEVLNMVAGTQVKIIDWAQRTNVGVTELDQLKSDLETLTKTVSKTKPLNKERSWFKTILDEIKADSDALLKKNNLALNSLQIPLDNLKKTIAALEVSQETETTPAQLLIQQLTEIETKIASLNDKRKTPFINVKNKKDLYLFITKTVTDAIDILKKFTSEIDNQKEIFKNQTGRIIEILPKIRRETENLTSSLLSIHPDEPWQLFVRGLSAEQIPSVIRELSVFETALIPRLKELPEPKIKLDERDILFHGVQTLTYLKRYNAGQPPGKFRDTKNLQFKLDQRIKTLDKTLGNEFKISEQFTNPLKNVYQEIKTQLVSSRQQVNKYEAKNPSQQAGKKTIIDFIDNKAIGSIDSVINSPIVDIGISKQTTNELWVRIYPDDIFVQTHEELLTEKEINAAKLFWKNWWASSGDKELQLVAFRNLTKGYGVRRAAWLARSLDPRKMVENVTALKTKPSENTIEASRLIDDVYLKLQPLTKSALDKTPQQIIGSIQPAVFDSFVPQLTKGAALLQLVKFEMHYFLQQLQSRITKLGAALNILIDKRNNLTLDIGNVLLLQIQALGRVVTAFEKVISFISKIEVLPLDSFIKRLAEPFKYPKAEKKDIEWSKAAHSECLPDRFVVVTVQNNIFSHIVVGEKIPDELQLGLNPADPNQTAFHLDENKDLQIDEKLRWMTEYKEAVKAGMAITVPLTASQAAQGFDQVFVIGVKNTAPDVSQQLLGKLFQNHIYAPDGMSFLKTGTPTNNTEKDKSGYNPDKDLEKVFNTEISQEKPARRKYISDTDSERLQKYLGLPNDILSKAVDHQNTSVSDAIIMNRALWHGTMGHYLEEMWDGVFTYDNIFRTEKFFLDNIVGRGFLPSVRVGEQPYGILPTTAFSQLDLYPGLTLPPLTVGEIKTTPIASLEIKLQQRFDMRLKQILDELQNEWKTFKVMHAGILNEGGEADSQKHNYMNMVGLHATSLNYNIRYGVNVGKGPELDSNDPQSTATNFNSADKFGPNGIFEKFKDLMYEGVYTQSFFYWSEEQPASFPSFKLQDERYNEILNNIQKSRIFIARFLETHPELKGKTVDRLAISDSPLSNNYIQWLLTNNPDQILASNNWATLPDKTLLFMLLRQSLMQAYQEAALSIMQAENLLKEQSRRDLGSTDNYLSFDFKKGKRSFSTKWHYLLKNLNDMEGFERMEKNNPFFNYLLAQSPARPAMSKYVFTNSDSMLKNPLFLNYPNKANHQKFLSEVDEVREAIRTLGTLPVKELEILLAEHLDLCTYRLDAWLLGFVNRRLRQHRLANPAGINLGAFGWVENLRPDVVRKQKPASEISKELTPVDQGPVYQDDHNEGFIHGPSLHHGVAAAILRAGYLGDKKNAGAGSRLSINLSSQRIRQALMLMNGIQNGLEIGAVLGFQFERGLHERYQLGVELDKYIQPLRKQYPLVEEIQDTADAKKPAYQTQVVNGNKLLEDVFKLVDWYNNNSEKTLETLLTENDFSKCPGFVLSLTNKANERTAIIKEIDRMADALDSLGDLIMSEGVYQIVKGNHVRAAAVLASFSPNPKTATSIPLPEIIETPRTGTIVTQRVVLSLPNKDALEAVAGWPNAEKTERAMAEPALNNWLGTTFGEAANIGCEVLIKPKTGNSESLFISADDLKWQPIDYFFYGLDESVLTKQIAWVVRNLQNIDDETEVLPLLKSKKDGRSFYEMDWLMGQIRQLLNGAKFTGNHDFLSADQQPDDSQNTGLFLADQFLLRAKNAFKSLQNTVDIFLNISAIKLAIDAKQTPEKTQLTNAEITKIYEALTNLSKFGIPNVIPALKISTEKEVPALVRQVIAADKEASKRILEAKEQLDKVIVTTPSQVKVDSANVALKAIFGKAFLALPQFEVTNITTIKAQLNNPFNATTGILRNGKGLVMEKWLQGISRVREKMYAVEMLCFGMESLGTGNLEILPAQLSYKEGDYWLGIEFPSDHIPAGDKLSVSVINPSNIGSVSTAVLIDDWVEIIPASSETTGLTFNYNQPNARPPQSLLLAVNPHDTRNWNWDDLVHTLRDTLALSKLRAVEPDHIEQSRYALVLPGIVAEVVPSEVRDDDGNALGVQLALDFINNN